MGTDSKGNPPTPAEEYRRFNPISEAELEAADPNFRAWARAIHEGRATKQVMRLYYFYSMRLGDPRALVPEGWRQEGVAVLRDAGRTRRAIEAFNAKRHAAGAASAGSESVVSDRLSLSTGDDASVNAAGNPATDPDGATASSSAGVDEAGTNAGPGLAASGAWVPIGPFSQPGRMTGMARPGKSQTELFASAADGGLWRTVDAGASWENLTPLEATQSGGAVVLDPDDPRTIYFGTGEGNGVLDNYPGIGLLKSTDGGVSWTVSNFFSDEIRALAIDETDTSRLYAAGEDGCFVSTDAGATFTVMSGGGLPSGVKASTIVIHPANPDRLYCAIMQGTESGVYRSDDKGETWTYLGTGLPAMGTFGRISLAFAPSNPGIMLMGTNLSLGTAYKSTDGGDTWSELTSAPVDYCASQCVYNNVVGFDFADPDVMYLGGIHAWRSDDGGGTWTRITNSSALRGSPQFAYVDQHFFLSDRAGEVFLANDGGLYRSLDYGSNWTEWSQGLDTTQYYGICRHPTDNVWMFGGTQDNGSHLRTGGDPPWQKELGADGGLCMHGPATGQVVLGETQNLNIRRSPDNGASWFSATSGIDQSEQKPFIGIMVVDPTDRLNMWTGTNRVYRSTDARATDWDPVSDSFSPPDRVLALEVAPSDSETVWAGLDDGALWRSTNALKMNPMWTETSSASMPAVDVRRIRVHPDDPSTVYAIFTGFGPDRIWKSTNGGSSWSQNVGDLPDVPVNDLLIDADNPGTLLAATDLGVYRSDDDGATWYGFSAGLPTAAAIEFTFDRDNAVLRVGTHGRSLWEFQPSQTVPTAVPDGSVVPGGGLRVDKTSAGGLRLTWDVAACTAADYNVFYGDLADVATLTYSGEECDLGTGGVAYVASPATSSGNAFIILAADDGAGSEGPHGFDALGGARSADGIGRCGITLQQAAATCP